MCQCVYIGGLTGVVRRRGHGMPLLTVIGVICSAIIAALAVGALTMLNRMRTLLFDALRASLEGLFKMIGHIPHLEAVGVNATSAIDYAMRNWMWFIGGIVFTFVLLNTMFGWWVLSRVIRRLSVIPDVHQLDPPAVAGAVGPVPARLHQVRFRYPRGESDALAPLSMNIDVGEHVAITGPNGSGKSTLMRILAGREPTSGQIERPGSVGLGAIGGTAIVMQHPESQVLGTKVADDVVWGLPADHKVDIDGLLREVGLEGMAEHSTSSLSGGELQRLAVASALARDPALLVADEITSMVDPQGRQDLLGCCPGSPSSTECPWCTSHISSPRPRPPIARWPCVRSTARRRAPRSRPCRCRRPRPRSPITSRRWCSSSIRSGTSTPAAHPGPKQHCAMCRWPCTRATGYSSTAATVREVHVRVDRGRIDQTHDGAVPARRPSGVRSGGVGGDQLPGRPVTAAAQPRRL